MKERASSSQPPSLFREELRRGWSELRGTRTSPVQRAAAVALGAFIGALPIYSLHTVLVLALCLWLRLDAAIGWLASNVSNPLIAPFLIAAEVEVGAYLVTGDFLPFDVPRLGDVIGYAFVGAPFVAAALALTGFAATLGAIGVKRRFVPAGPARAPYALPAGAPPLWHAIERVAARHAPPPGARREPSRFHLVRYALLRDRTTAFLAERPEGAEPRALGAVLDVGVRRAALPLVLLELGAARSVHAVGADRRALERTRRAAARAPALALSVVVAPASEWARACGAAYDTIVMCDVLEGLEPDAQAELVTCAARALAPGGGLYLRVLDRAHALPGFASRLRARLFGRGRTHALRTSAEWQALMRAAQLEVHVAPAAERRGSAHVLLVGERAREPARG